MLCSMCIVFPKCNGKCTNVREVSLSLSLSSCEWVYGTHQISCCMSYFMLGFSIPRFFPYFLLFSRFCSSPTVCIYLYAPLMHCVLDFNEYSALLASRTHRRRILFMKLDEFYSQSENLYPGVRGLKKFQFSKFCVGKNWALF